MKVCKCRIMCVVDGVGMEVFEDVVCSRDFKLYSSRHQEGLCLHVYGLSCSMPNYLRARW